jgi:hypothetical protein
MVMDSERLKILQMVEEGKISAEDAVSLLEALRDSSGAAQRKTTTENVYSSTTGKPKFLRVMVTDTDSGKTRVNVRLPIGMLKAGVKMGMKFAPEVEGMDMGELMQFVESGELGKFVDVYDDEDGEHVEVYVE